MNFKKYQKEALKLASYPNVGSNFIYPTLGLNGESGEVAEKVKKIIRDKGSIWDLDTRDQIKKELGDVLWYVALTSYEFDLDLDDVAHTNIKKLKSRKARSQIHGNGDDR